MIKMSWKNVLVGFALGMLLFIATSLLSPQFGVTYFVEIMFIVTLVTWQALNTWDKKQAEAAKATGSDAL